MWNTVSASHCPNPVRNSTGVCQPIDSYGKWCLIDSGAEPAPSEWHDFEQVSSVSMPESNTNSTQARSSQMIKKNEVTPTSVPP